MGLNVLECVAASSSSPTCCQPSAIDLLRVDRNDDRYSISFDLYNANFVAWLS